MKTKNSARRISRILLGGLVSIFMTGTLMVGSVQAGEGYGDAHGGVPGCSGLVLAYCFGAVWRWYPTTSNSVYVSGTVNDSTCMPDGVASGGYITGCGDYGGYWRYAWVAQNPGSNSYCGYSYPKYSQRGLVPIGSGDYVSAYFGGLMKYAYGYSGYLNQNTYGRDGTWSEVRDIYLALRDQDPYTFSEGWSYGSRLSWFCGPKTVEEVVPQVTYYELKAKAVDRQGNYISVINDVSSGQVEEGSYGSVTKRNKTGYTFYGFKSGRYDTNYMWTDSTYGQTMWSDRTIYAVYEQQVFSARARVYEGTTMSGNGKSTGYIKTSNTQNLEVDCVNAGCNVAFDLGVKTEKGAGNINFTVYRSKNGGSGVTQTTYKAAPFAPSTSGETLQVYRNSAYQDPYVEKLYPGESVCYYIVFSPDGGSNVTVKACASAKVSTFQGKVGVSTKSGDETINWTATSTTVTKNITDCSPVTGCKVSFNHNLKRTAGIGSTDYTITRTSNYTIKVSNRNLASGTESFSTNPHRIYDDNDLILVPGQVVCETLTFKANNNTVTVPSDTVLKLCASALGKAQPDDPTEPTVMGEDDLSDAFIDMRVKNADGPDKYKGYQSVVYAKPGQNVTYRATYNPILQYSYNVVVQKMRIDSGSIIPSSGVNTSKNLKGLYDDNRGSYSVWRNAMTVHGSEGMASYSKIHTYDVGDTSKRSEKNTYGVKISDVGKDLAESATTNLRKNNDAAMTPSQVTFTSNGTNKNNLATINTSSKTEIAHAYVPYNFDTKTEVKTDNDKPIYAVEEKEIKYEIAVEPRKNPETQGNSDSDKPYATIVPDFVGKVVIYQPIHGEKPASDGWGSGKTNDVCNYFGLSKNTTTCYYDNEETSPLNLTGNVDGVINERILKLNTPDLEAGTYICVAVATYPSNSGAYTNWSEKEGNKKWRISGSKCFLIAKRPSFQVWGGSLYAGGSVKTSAAIKTSLRGLASYTGVMVFSSWVEQSVAAKGQVVALASGAATGLSSNIAGGGSHEPSPDYCKYRVPLSIANYSTSMVAGICPNQATGNSGIAASLTNRISLVAPLPNEDSTTFEYSGNTTITLNNSTKNIVRYNINGNATIGTNSVSTGKTHIIKATGDVTISGNINYQAATFTSLDQIPKLIIYGNNVTIGCTVTNIDAIIIAEKDLNTCVSSNINNRENSYQLMVNGAIVTNNLYLNRTYGAATGVNSKIQAETVNYDASVLLWGRAKADPDNEHKNLTSVYIHDIAPRY